jgi:hypothetical protein
MTLDETIAKLLKLRETIEGNTPVCIDGDTEYSTCDVDVRYSEWDRKGERVVIY